MNVSLCIQYVQRLHVCVFSVCGGHDVKQWQFKHDAATK